jgi:hypothetical protein
MHTTPPDDTTVARPHDPSLAPPVRRSRRALRARTPLRTGAAALATATLAALAGLAFDATPAGAGPVASVVGAGGSSIDGAHAVAVDAAGNSIVVGSFSQTATFYGGTAKTLTSAGGSDSYLASYSPTGSLQWIKRFGGTQMDVPYDVALDGSGNIYVVGVTYSPTVTYGSGVSTTGTLDRDAFLAKFSPTGTALWARLATGPSAETFNGVAVWGTKVFVAGDAGDATVTFTGSPSISAVPGDGVRTGVIGAFDTSGKPSWIQLDNNAEYHDVEANGVVAVGVGTSWGDATYGKGGAQQEIDAKGMADGVVAAYSVGGTLAWVDAVDSPEGADDHDALYAALLSGDRLYAGGALQDDGVVVSYDYLAGAALEAQVLSGSARITTLDAGPGGVVAAGGSYVGTVTVPMASGGPLQRTALGSSDSLVATFGRDLGGALWVEVDGGTDGDWVQGVAVDAHGTLVGVGSYGGQATFGTTTLSSAGNLDAFVMRYRTGPGFHGLTPARILDTRKGIGGPGTKLGPGEARTLKVTGVGGVPAAGVTAVAVNVTAVNGTATSRLTVWPGNVLRPEATSLSFGPVEARPNLDVVKVSADGTINYWNATGSVDVIMDVVGWYDLDGSGGRFAGVEPARLLDTRKAGSGGAFGPAEQRELVVAGVGGVPTDATSVVLNLTVTNPTAASHLTVWPAGVPRPTASNLNYESDQTVPNLVVVKVGAGKKVSIFNNAGHAHVIADVVGYFTGGPAEGQLTAVAPVRLLDTKVGTGGPATPIGAGEVRTTKVAGVGSVPASAKAVVVNVTATSPSADSHLTVWPAGAPKPPSSNLNMTAGQAASNLVMVKLGADGGLALRNNSGTAHLQVDVVGWYG